MQNPFDLEIHYRKYLELARIDESKMSPAQKRETKRAFMAGCGQMLLTMRDDLSKLEEYPAIAALESMHKQVCQFWLNENNRQN